MSFRDHLGDDDRRDDEAPPPAGEAEPHRPWWEESDAADRGSDRDEGVALPGDPPPPASGPAAPDPEQADRYRPAEDDGFRVEDSAARADRDEAPGEGRWAVLTKLIALGLVVIGVYQLSQLARPIDWQNAFIGMPFVASLQRFGVEPGALLERGELWRLFTSLVVFPNLVWLLFTAWGIWSLGPFVERFSGFAVTVIVIFATLVAGGLAFSLTHAPGHLHAGGFSLLFGFKGYLLGVGLVHRRRLPPGFVRRILLRSAFYFALITALHYGLNPGAGIWVAILAQTDLAGAMLATTVLGTMLPCRALVKPSEVAVAFSWVAALVCIGLVGFSFVPALLGRIVPRGGGGGGGTFWQRGKPSAFANLDPDALVEHELPKARLAISVPAAWSLDGGQAKKKHGAYGFTGGGWMAWRPMWVEYRPRNPWGDAPDTLLRVRAESFWRTDPNVSDLALVDQGAFDGVADGLTAAYHRLRCVANGQPMWLDEFCFVGERGVYTITFFDQRDETADGGRALEEAIARSLRVLPD